MHRHPEAGGDKFDRDGEYGTDPSVNPGTGMVAVFQTPMHQRDQSPALVLFLKTVVEVLRKAGK